MDPAAPIGLLPLLERSRGEVVEEVERCERELGLPVAALMSRVPLDQIPRIALATNMDYRARRALEWMDGGMLTDMRPLGPRFDSVTLSDPRQRVVQF